MSIREAGRASEICAEVFFEYFWAQALFDIYPYTSFPRIWNLKSPRQEIIRSEFRKLMPDGCDVHGVFRHSEQRRMPHSPVIIK